MEDEKKSKAIVLDMDETLISHIKGNNNNYMMVLRPDIDSLIAKLQEAKEQGIEIILCSTANQAWVDRLLSLKPEFRTLFDKLYTSDNERDWKNFTYKQYPLEYNIDYNGKPVTTFGYDSVLFIDDITAEGFYLRNLFNYSSYSRLNFTKMVLRFDDDDYEEFYPEEQEPGEDEQYDSQVYYTILSRICSEDRMPSRRSDVTYFSGGKFAIDERLYNSIIMTINDPKSSSELKNKIEEYIEHINHEPGCQMMCSEISAFMNKEFAPGLTTSDEKYSARFEEYRAKKSRLEDELKNLGVDNTMCPDSIIEEYISQDRQYPFEGINTEIVAEITAASATRNLLPQALSEVPIADQVERDIRAATDQVFRGVEEK